MRRWLVIIEDDENVLGRDAKETEAGLEDAIARTLHAYGREGAEVVVAVVGQDPTMTSTSAPDEKFPQGTVHYGATAVR